MITKLAYISDLHFSGWISKLESMANCLITKANPDGIVFGGDIATSLYGIERVLATFRGKFQDQKLYVVAGNHDLWTNHNNCKNSKIIYDKGIAEVCSKYNTVYLDKHSEIIEVYNTKVGVCGSICWYDYSAKYPGLPMPDEYYAYNKKSYNNDGNFIQFKEGIDDKKFSAQVCRKLRKEVAKIYKDIDYLIMFTHVPIFKESIIWRDQFGAGADWNIGTAYFYNLTLGDYAKTLDKLKLVVSGHTHFGYDGYTRPGKNPIRNIVSASDYDHPEAIIIDFCSDTLFDIDRFFFNNYI